MRVCVCMRERKGEREEEREKGRQYRLSILESDRSMANTLLRLSVRQDDFYLVFETFNFFALKMKQDEN